MSQIVGKSDQSKQLAVISPSCWVAPKRSEFFARMESKTRDVRCITPSE